MARQRTPAEQYRQVVGTFLAFAVLSILVGTMLEGAEETEDRSAIESAKPVTAEELVGFGDDPVVWTVLVLLAGVGLGSSLFWTANRTLMLLAALVAAASIVYDVRAVLFEVHEGRELVSGVALAACLFHGAAAMAALPGLKRSSSRPAATYGTWKPGPP